LDVLARGLSREFPNPERVGCSDSSILRGIASHKLPLSQAAPWFDHLSACSPCFQDFNKFRREAASQRRRVQVWLAAAAVLLFAVGGSLWLRSRLLTRTTDIAVLDLRDRSVARGGEPSKYRSVPIVDCSHDQASDFGVAHWQQRGELRSCFVERYRRRASAGDRDSPSGGSGRHSTS
jgi:hypothetical protein